MQTATEDIITQKVRELCQTIIGQPEFQSLRRDVDAFLADEQAQAQYQTVSEKGESLQFKQSTGAPLEHTEIMEFEKHRETLLANPVARRFIDAQQEMHKVQESVQQYVSKTFELGRVPEETDFEHGSCGHGCGCSH